ncbi:xylose isomerase-like protein [Collybia nuda]|uniref:Xylose isomerase-like protein n=1 Tax=Collybia nuda TaxID=64659 RepID=A0A9P5XS27_9AGAR|nr:xylose isomerase-like protein [Collybia nuda]
MSSVIPYQSIPVAIPSMCLGRAWMHELDVKFSEAGKAGFKGVEMFWEDLVWAAKKFDPGADEKNEAVMLRAAQYARDHCDKNGLSIMALQPFLNYEGLLDKEKHREMIVKLKLWFKIVKILGTDLIQVPSQMNQEGTTGNIDRIVADIREIGELGLQESPPVRFAYEALSWGAHINLWEQAWDVVVKVDLPNVGTVLDTYHIAGLVYADPTSPTGKQPTAEADFTTSLRLMETTPGLINKLFYAQLSDAERLTPPLSPSHPFFDPTQPPLMQWSRNARLFPCELDRGGYLPVVDIARVWFEKLGFRGWVSLEIFSRTMSEAGEGVPRDHARRGIESWNKLVKELGGA